MNKKMILKVFSFVVACVGLISNGVYAYKPEAVNKALLAARDDPRVRFMFTNYIPNRKISEILGSPIGIHNVSNYCWLLRCSEKELAQLLDGAVIHGNDVDNKMKSDFYELASYVRSVLLDNTGRDK